MRYDTAATQGGDTAMIFVSSHRDNADDGEGNFSRRILYGSAQIHRDNFEITVQKIEMSTYQIRICKKMIIEKNKLEIYIFITFKKENVNIEVGKSSWKINFYYDKIYKTKFIILHWCNRA